MRARIREETAKRAASLRVTGWRSRTTGWACGDNLDGHEPRVDDLISRTEAQMGAPSECKHCGRDITWDPKQ